MPFSGRHQSPSAGTLWPVWVGCSTCVRGGGGGGGRCGLERSTVKRPEGGTNKLGALDGGSIMSHVDFKKWQCHMSLSLIFLNVSSMSHVKFEK